MRVLVVHNHYSSRVPSGENLAVRDEVGWLREAGVEVHLHEAHLDDVVSATPLDKVRQAAWTPWSLPAGRAMVARVREVEPELVHLHNPFPLLTASVVRAATGLGLPVVWTTHNRRITCVDGGNFRDGAICRRCRPGWRVPGIRYACYADSTAASALLTVSSSIFRTVARRRITAIAISEHMKRWLVDQAGFDPERVQVKHNGVAGPDLGTTATPAEDSRVFLFVGRLDEHKGIGLLLDAWDRTRNRLDAQLHVLGDGAMADAVRAAADGDPRLRWFGNVPHAEVADHLATARVVVVPAMWEEPFGRVATEALAHRRGLISTRQGGLAEIVDDRSDWVVEPEPDALANALIAAGGPEADLPTRTRLGHERYERAFSPAATTRRLIEIYDDAMQRHREPVRRRRADRQDQGSGRKRNRARSGSG